MCGPGHYQEDGTGDLRTTNPLLGMSSHATDFWDGGRTGRRPPGAGLTATAVTLFHQGEVFCVCRTPRRASATLAPGICRGGRRHLQAHTRKVSLHTLPGLRDRARYL